MLTGGGGGGRDVMAANYSDAAQRLVEFALERLQTFCERIRGRDPSVLRIGSPSAGRRRRLYPTGGRRLVPRHFLLESIRAPFRFNDCSLLLLVRFLRVQ